MTDRAIVVTYTSGTTGVDANQRETDAIRAATAAGYSVVGTDRITGPTPATISASKARSLLRGRADAIAFHNGQAVRIVRAV